MELINILCFPCHLTLACSLTQQATDPRELRRDSEALYNKMTIRNLTDRYPQVTNDSLLPSVWPSVCACLSVCGVSGVFLAIGLSAVGRIAISLSRFVPLHLSVSVAVCVFVGLLGCHSLSLLLTLYLSV